MSLDVNTPKGQESVEQELAAIRLFEEHFPEFTYIKTAKDDAAVVDGILEKAGVVCGLAETKCRKMDLAHFTGHFKSQWLITFDKLVIARRLADDLLVPLWGFLYLIVDGTLLTKKLYDPRGGWQASFDVRRRPTQATCNGGTALRFNSYVDMTDATVIKPTGDST